MSEKLYDIIPAIIAVLPGIVMIAHLLDHAKNKVERRVEKHEIAASYLNSRITWMEDKTRLLETEINYHLHGGVPDTLCDAAREWRDGDISSSYYSSNGVSIPGMTKKTATLPPGMYCRYCHMRLSPTDLMCSHCGAQILDSDAIRLWGGK